MRKIKELSKRMKQIPQKIGEKIMIIMTGNRRPHLSRLTYRDLKKRLEE